MHSPWLNDQPSDDLLPHSISQVISDTKVAFFPGEVSTADLLGSESSGSEAEAGRALVEQFDLLELNRLSIWIASSIYWFRFLPLPGETRSDCTSVGYNSSLNVSSIQVVCAASVWNESVYSQQCSCLDDGSIQDLRPLYLFFSSWPVFIPFQFSAHKCNQNNIFIFNLGEMVSLVHRIKQKNIILLKHIGI